MRMVGRTSGDRTHARAGEGNGLRAAKVGRVRKKRKEQLRSLEVRRKG